MKEAYLLAIDPGNSTGWSLMAEDGTDLLHGICRTRDELYKVLEMVPEAVQTVVMEDYRLFQHKAVQQSGSTLETVRVIGAVESWANLRGLVVHLQPASILPIAKLWSGIKPKGSHRDNHHISAILHGYFWLMKNDHIKPVRR